MLAAEALPNTRPQPQISRPTRRSPSSRRLTSGTEHHREQRLEELCELRVSGDYRERSAARKEDARSRQCLRVRTRASIVGDLHVHRNLEPVAVQETMKGEETSETRPIRNS